MLNRIKTYQQFIYEGVGDIYANKEFHIPYDNFISTTNSKNDKPIIKIKGINVFKNPKDLSNFDSNVRALGTIGGDIYIIEKDFYILHGDLGDELNKKGFISLNRNRIGQIYDELDKFVLLHRVKNTNLFGLSDTNYNYDMNNSKKVDKIIENINNKNKNIKIINEHHEYIKK